MVIITVVVVVFVVAVGVGVVVIVVVIVVIIGELILDFLSCGQKMLPCGIFCQLIFVITKVIKCALFPEER